LDGLKEILKYALGRDTNNVGGIFKYYYLNDAHSTYYCLDNIPFGYTAKPISWFYESDSDEAPQPERKPIGWRLNIDVPSWSLKKGDKTDCINTTYTYFLSRSFPNEVMPHIATPIYDDKPMTAGEWLGVNFPNDELEAIEGYMKYLETYKSTNNE
jgi:hypothetical protein